MITIEVQHGTLEVGGKFMPWIDDGAKRQFVVTTPIEDKQVAETLARNEALAERVRIFNQEIRQDLLWGSSGFLTLHEWRIANHVTEIIDALVDNNGEALERAFKSLVDYGNAARCYTPEELNLALQQGVEL